MSTGAGTFPAPGVFQRPDLESSSIEENVSSFADRTLGRYFDIRTYEDGITLILLLGMLASVAWSVQLAGWLEGPNTQVTVLVGGIVGALAARHRLRWPIAPLAAFTIGWVVVFWQGGPGADGDNIIATSRDIWDRFFLWMDAARNDGISRDSLPFQVMLLTVAWLVSFTSSWILFKFRNVWITVTMLGVAIIINLSYRQGQYEHTLYIFLAIAVVLFAHITSVQRAAAWTEAGMKFPAHLRRLSMQYGIALAIPVVLIASVLPMWEPRNDQLGAVWDTFKDPFRALDKDFGRLLSGVRGKDANGFGQFRESLPFQGSIDLPDDPVMFVDTVFPTLHAGRIYSEYTSQGWQTGETREEPTLAGQVLARRDDLKSRQLITQRFIPVVDASWVMPVGAMLSLNLDGINEVLAPVEWNITMDPEELGSVPDDIQLFADKLWDEFLFLDTEEDPPSGNQAVQSTVSDILPPGLTATLTISREGALIGVRTSRLETPPNEQIAFTPKKKIDALDPYIVDQLITTASDEDLNEAGTDYPAWITDRYLQLPESLPLRVRELAREIVIESQGGTPFERASEILGIGESGAAITPFEKVTAIQGFLQQQGYTQTILGPTADQDAIDYFLFETQAEACPRDGSPNPCRDDQLKGYSQYFGSAASVLLRSVGVPTRMIAGYAPGVFLLEQSRFVVLGSDRHGWAQAYFPGYGWIDVEATPGYGVFGRGVPVQDLAESPGANRLTNGQLFEAEFFPEDLSEFESQALALASQRLQEDAESGTSFPVLRVAIPILSILIIAIVSTSAWNFGMGRLTPAERTYLKMSRLARFAGLGREPSQTPREYASRLAAQIPTISAQAVLVAEAYQSQTYGPQSSGDDEADYSRAWKRIRRALIGRSGSRLIGRA
ncbi:MAG: transglutaminase domain-containing protein [Chloroflexi bacterium]|nr:transglutaminase domain-containing protein [Chloroflexota bacterium]